MHRVDELDASPRLTHQTARPMPRFGDQDMCDLVRHHVPEDDRPVDGGAMSGPLDAAGKDPDDRRSRGARRRGPEGGGRYSRGTASVRPQNDDRNAQRIRSESVGPLPAWNDLYLDANPPEHSVQLSQRHVRDGATKMREIAELDDDGTRRWSSDGMIAAARDEKENRGAHDESPHMRPILVAAEAGSRLLGE
jgi:hypothetical protein